VNLAVLVDMNLSPDWIAFLQQFGHAATHWTAVGSAAALDPEIADWARNNTHIILTQDLDFGAILAQTHATGPSVIILRCEDTFPGTMGPPVLTVLRQYETELRDGALVVIDVARHRVRLLPIV